MTVYPDHGATSGRTVRRRSMKIAGVLAVPAVLLVAWYCTSLLVESTIFVTPYQGIFAFFSQFSDVEFYGDLAYTLKAVAIGFVLSVTVGLILGFLFGLNRSIERIANTLAYGMYSIPKVTLYPLCLLFLGLGLLSQVAFVFLHGVFPVLVITMSTVGLVSRNYAKLAAANLATNTQYFLKILVPAVVPSLMSGLRISFSACFLAQILAELFSSNVGLGGELRKGVTLTDMSSIVGVVLVVAVIAVIISQAFQQAETAVLRHRGHGVTPAPDGTK